LTCYKVAVMSALQKKKIQLQQDPVKHYTDPLSDLKVLELIPPKTRFWHLKFEFQSNNVTTVKTSFLFIAVYLQLFAGFFSSEVEASYTYVLKICPRINI